ncbi:MAG: TetR/AcrR family transcriptional regulator [Deltaproteobacteria bacterium]|nr:TetR/AcrR family transcriptional regulator [Deltaproteobacteria bacterium]MBW2444940.1 TetR/AcrR family transcriptional regulator [Deltaproteobacteria bacterium]
MPAPADPLDRSSESPSRRDKRALILEAAIHVFARNGYHGSRIADIASEAGIAYGLVYHYFKNKEEILSSIFEERWGAFLDTLEHIASQPASARAKLDQVATVILGGHHVRPEWVKVLVLEIQRSSRFARPDQIRAVGRLFQIVARILREGQEKGELRMDIDPDVACYSFIGALEIIITGVVLNVIQPDSASLDPTEPSSGEERRDGAYYEKVGRTVVDIFLNGVARSGGTG